MLGTLWHALFGHPVEPPEIDPRERQSLREQIHRNRNELMKSVAVARHTEAVSHEAKEAIDDAAHTLREIIVGTMHRIRDDR